jgi:cytochrome c
MILQLAVFAATLFIAADVPSGKDLFLRRCGGCHALDREKTGPRLGGVYGRKAASVKTFDYSDALKGSKIVWNAETLERWLTDPEAMVPGNDMAFRMENGDERRAIIEYLKGDQSRR